MRCAGWLYRASGSRDPIVVLAHGFAFTREARLDDYARRFVTAGLAVLVFDYRHFGDSDGQPRQLMDIAAQLADWRAAIAFARSLDGIDGDQVALWGTSFSGGHVAALAAEDSRVAAVISQVPYSGLGGRRRLPRPVFLARMVIAALRDEVRGRLGLAPAFLPLVAEPGSDIFAPFVEAGATVAIRELFPASYAWQNQFTPRVMLRLPRYRPLDTASAITCPWLVLVCDQDTVTPANQAAALASRAPNMELHRFPIGHFEVYSGQWFERAVAVQVEFLSRHLLSPGTFHAKSHLR